MAETRFQAKIQATICGKLNPSELLHTAVVLVLKDDGFAILLTPAREARKSAETLLEWSSDSENKVAWYEFANKLITSLLGCFKTHINQRRIQKKREKMWEKFHNLRSSESFTTDWVTLLTV